MWIPSECIGEVRVSRSSGQGQGHRSKNWIYACN